MASIVTDFVKSSKKLTMQILCEISGSHGGEYEVQSLLRCALKSMSIDVSEVRAASIIALMMEAARTSETSVDIYFKKRQHISEDSELQCKYYLKLQS
jgi:hypothetical protein